MISMNEVRELAKIAGSIMVGIIIYRWYVFFRTRSEEKKKEKRKRRERW